MRSLTEIIAQNEYWANRELVGRANKVASIDLELNGVSKREIKRIIAILLRYLNSGQAISLNSYISIIDGKIHVDNFAYTVDTLPEQLYPIVMKAIVRAYEHRR